MGLEIQHSVNSMMSNMNTIQKYLQEQALGAITGVAKVAGAAATGGASLGAEAAGASIQQVAAQQAAQSAYNAIEAKKTQRANSNINRISDYMRDYKERTNG